MTKSVDSYKVWFF